MRILLISILAISLSPAAAAKNKKPTDSQEPVVFGILSQNVGCVIFREYRKTSGMFWGVAVTTKTVSQLEVIETQNYKLEQTTWNETQQEDMNELQRMAVKDKIKFVKIPNKNPTDEQLEKARTLCKQPS
jgi:hypothetical protein